MTVFLLKSECAHQCSSNKEKMNHLLFMDDLKLYAKNAKGLKSLVQTVRIFNNTGMEFDADKCATISDEEESLMEFHCLMEDSCND